MTLPTHEAEYRAAHALHCRQVQRTSSNATELRGKVECRLLSELLVRVGINCCNSGTKMQKTQPTEFVTVEGTGKTKGSSIIWLASYNSF